ncbi:hypothetical protein D3C78_1492770 [compost metagenome]
MPTIVLVKGINKTIRMMNGMERNTFTTIEITLYRVRFWNNPPRAVKNSARPSAMPSTKVATPESAVMYNVSSVAAQS